MSHSLACIHNEAGLNAESAKQVQLYYTHIHIEQNKISLHIAFQVQTISIRGLLYLPLLHLMKVTDRVCRWTEE